MLLPDKSGVRCDFCGGVSKGQFVYYSMEATRFQVLSLSSLPQQANFNKDMCDACYNATLDRCRANLGAAKRGAIKCDLCKKYHTGSFAYHRLIIARADVDVQRAKPVEVEYRVMDLNVGPCCMTELETRVSNTASKLKQEGQWS